MEKIEQNFYRKQLQQREDTEKQIYIGQEFVSHYQIKIEEAQAKLQQTEKTIETLDFEYEEKLKKRMQSRKILKYINFFMQFYEFFQQGKSKQEQDEFIKNFHHDAHNKID